MNREELLDLFRRCSALLEGHFRLSSGLHSPGYLQCALVLQHPQHAGALGSELADRVRDLRPTTVLSPALGGLIIGHEVARALRAAATKPLQLFAISGYAQPEDVSRAVEATNGCSEAMSRIARSAVTVKRSDRLA